MGVPRPLKWPLHSQDLAFLPVPPPHTTTLGKLYFISQLDTYLWTTVSLMREFLWIWAWALPSQLLVQFSTSVPSCKDEAQKDLRNFLLLRHNMISVLPAINETRVLSPALVCSYLILHYHLYVQQDHFFGQESRPHCNKCCIAVVRRNIIFTSIGL